MAEFVDEFMKQFGPDVSRQVSSNLGLTPKAASQVIPAVIPMILGGLKRQMETRGGSGSEGRGGCSAACSAGYSANAGRF